jgi:hypothetical protein
MAKETQLFPQERLKTVERIVTRMRNPLFRAVVHSVVTRASRPMLPLVVKAVLDRLEDDRMARRMHAS